MNRSAIAIFLSLGAVGTFAQEPPKELLPYYQPPAEYVGKLGNYRSPLLFDDGRKVQTAAQWQQRRGEILKYWHQQMGAWPAPLTRPTMEVLSTEKQDGITWQKIRLQTAPERLVDDAWLLTPPGKGPFPAVVVVFYEANTAVGRGKSEFRDYAIQLAKRGFVALSLGGDPNTYYPTKETCTIQPLSFHAYEASNCRRFLANLPHVDAKRIGVVGHSYGGKWAMFAACLDEEFACGAWSDPGIVFDESRSNVNYWEPWYLGFDRKLPMQRSRGIPNEKNLRTGPYRTMMEQKRDLHELHALMAPRPMFVSGGAEDPPARWEALNHTVQVNELLGAKYRVAMTNRKLHSPDAEANRLLYAFFEHTLGNKDKSE
ncbi:MAG: prolyl oligopeptidase family serine peptidase [Zavarzinella sp.]